MSDINSKQMNNTVFFICLIRTDYTCTWNKLKAENHDLSSLVCQLPTLGKTCENMENHQEQDEKEVRSGEEIGDEEEESQDGSR